MKRCSRLDLVGCEITCFSGRRMFAVLQHFVWMCIQYICLCVRKKQLNFTFEIFFIYIYIYIYIYNLKCKISLCIYIINYLFIYLFIQSALPAKNENV